MTFQLNIKTADDLADEAQAQLMASIQRAVDQHIEDVAKSRDYNSAAHLAGYASSTVEAWADEAQAFVAWRDQVWVFVYGWLESVLAGGAAPPETPEDLTASLSQITWPE